MREELSEREKQVAAHLTAGLRVAGVASELCIAEITVRNHLRNIFARLDVHSQAEPIALLRREPALLGAYRGVSSPTTSASCVTPSASNGARGSSGRCSG